MEVPCFKSETHQTCTDFFGGIFFRRFGSPCELSARNESVTVGLSQIRASLQTGGFPMVSLYTNRKKGKGTEPQTSTHPHSPLPWPQFPLFLLRRLAGGSSAASVPSMNEAAERPEMAMFGKKRVFSFLTCWELLKTQLTCHQTPSRGFSSPTRFLLFANFV